MATSICSKKPNISLCADRSLNVPICWHRATLRFTFPGLSSFPLSAFLITIDPAIVMSTASLEGRGRLLVVIRPSAFSRLPLYEWMKAQGFTVAMVYPSSGPFAPWDAPGLFDHWINSETCDPDALDRALRDYADAHHLTSRVAAIFTFDEYGVYPAAVVAQRWGLRPLPFEPELISTMNNKHAFRDWCVTNGVRGPRSAAISERDVLAAKTEVDRVAVIERLLAAKGIQLPVIVKPAAGAGKIQISRAASLEEVLRRLLALFDALRQHADFKHLRFDEAGVVTALVEEYIGGDEVDIDCIIDHGVVRFASISDNFPSPYVQPVEVGGLAPSALTTSAQVALHQLLRDYVDRCPSLHGVLHFEAKYDYDRGHAYVIEVNCRMGSAETFTMVQSAFGVHLGEAVVRCVLGEPLGPYPHDGSPGGSRPTQDYFASVNIYVSKAGVLRRRELPVAAAHWVDGGYTAAAAIGSAVLPPTRMGRMVAWIVARGPTAEAARRHVEALTAAATFDVESTE